jgi:hypothetical protein
MKTLPPFLMTSESGSFARRTIEERKPIIIDRILSHFDYTPSIRTRLLKFKDELKSGMITSLTDQSSDREIWDSDLQPWIGKSWLDIPWLFAETFFYRKILEIVKYFQPGPWMGVDPYQRLKEVELQDSLVVFLESYKSQSYKGNFENLQEHTTNALWGNRGDLSNLDVFENDMSAQHERIILNHIEPAFSFISSEVESIAYFFDNIGKELYFDLAFIDFLIQSELAKSVTCYLKNQPFFVSDAMPKDLINAINHLESSQSPDANALAHRFSQLINSRKVTLEAPPFFTTSRSYHHFPSVLQKQVGEHDLVILKGDVNFRRLFGDCHWDPTTPIEDAGDYFPTSFLSLRTLKGELILGLTSEQSRNLHEHAEKNWMVNGNRGMITFFQKST